MSGTGIRCSVRLALTLAIAFISAQARSAQQDAEEPKSGVSIVAAPLSYQVSVTEMPCPVAVTLKNYDLRFTGTLEAWIGEHNQACITRRAVNVGKGAFIFHLYPQVESSDPELTLYVRLLDARGRTADEYPVKLRRSKASLSLASVINRNYSVNDKTLAELKPSVAIIRRTEQLPDEWHGYMMFHAIFWDGGIDAPLSPEQRKALADWIRAGGCLVLHARTGDTTVKSPVPELIHDLHITQAGTVFSAAEMPSGSAGRFARKHVGLGNITFLRCDAAELPKWKPADLAELAGRNLRELGDSGQEALNPNDLEYRARREQFEELALSRDRFSQQLALMSGYTALNFKPILITMLIYILTVSVIDYFVLRRMRKLPWTWLTFPLLIAGFSVFSYFAFYSGNIGDLTRSEIRLVDIAKDGSGKIETFNCIRNNSNKPIRFTIEQTHALIDTSRTSEDYYGGYNYRYRRASYSSQSAGQSQLHINTEMRANGTLDAALAAYIGSYRFFGEQWVIQNEIRPFTCNLKKDGKKLTGSVENTTKSAPTSAFILYDGKVFELDPSLAIKKGAASNDSLLRRPEGLSPIDTCTLIIKNAAWAWPAGTTWMAPDDTYTYRSVPQKAPFGSMNYTATGDAVLFAFFEENDKYAGMPVRRIKCIRQIVEVR